MREFEVSDEVIAEEMQQQKEARKFREEFGL